MRSPLTGRLCVAFSLISAQAWAAVPAKPPKGRPEGAAEYTAQPRPDDGANLALTVQKLQKGLLPPRPLLIWAIGSSYTNMLGDGKELATLIRQRFPQAPEIAYKKMVGNSAPFQYIRGWVHHLVLPDQPDVVLIYTIGKPADLEKLIIDLRRGCTADIIVPSIHWRERCKPNWGKAEDAPDQNVSQIRDICRKYGVEFVENRREWGEYLAANRLQIEDLLKDAVHQSDYGATIINMNIARHFHAATRFAYDPLTRERRVSAGDPAIRLSDCTLTASPRPQIVATQLAARIELPFVGNRVDLIGVRSPGGGTFRVRIDGQRAEQVPAMVPSYIQPGTKNARTPTCPPRDAAPHGIGLGKNLVPQKWTIRMISDQGDYELTGSITGTDGRGNSGQSFTSRSGQILIDPELWRNPKVNRTGDLFTFDVQRATVGEVQFRGETEQVFCQRLTMGLANGPHSLELTHQGDGQTTVLGFDVFSPPLTP